MTLSDYWAPGPPSPGFDQQYVYFIAFFMACFSGDGVPNTFRYTGSC